MPMSRLCIFRIPRTTTDRRMACIPYVSELLFDTDMNMLFIGDGKTPGGLMVQVGQPVWMATGSVANNVPVFDVSGKLRDSGRSIDTLLTGPKKSTADNVAVFSGDNGTVLKDSGRSINRVVIGPDKSYAGNVAIFSDDTGNKVEDSHFPIKMFAITPELSFQNIGDIPEISAVDPFYFGKDRYQTVLKSSGIAAIEVVRGQTSSSRDNIPVYVDKSGTWLKDSRRSITDLVSGPKASVVGNIPAFSSTNGKELSDSGKAIKVLVVNPSYSKDGNIPIFDGTSGTTLKDGGKSIGDLQSSIDSKAAATHDHSLATKATPGLMSADDKTKLDDLPRDATNILLAPLLAIPSPLGTASAGTGETAARNDHVHAMPTIADVTGLEDTLKGKAELGHKHDPSMASRATLGSIKVGGNLTIDANGVLSVTDVVKSIGGKDGIVTLTPADINAATSSHTHPEFVVGPDSSGQDSLAAFSGSTGKLLRDSGILISALQSLLSKTSDRPVKCAYSYSRQSTPFQTKAMLALSLSKAPGVYHVLFGALCAITTSEALYRAIKTRIWFTESDALHAISERGMVMLMGIYGDIDAFGSGKKQDSRRDSYTLNASAELVTTDGELPLSGTSSDIFYTSIIVGIEVPGQIGTG